MGGISRRVYWNTERVKNVSTYKYTKWPFYYGLLWNSIIITLLIYNSMMHYRNDGVLYLWVFSFWFHGSLLQYPSDWFPSESCWAQWERFCRCNISILLVMMLPAVSVRTWSVLSFPALIGQFLLMQPFYLPFICCSEMLPMQLFRLSVSQPKQNPVFWEFPKGLTSFVKSWTLCPLFQM